MMIGNKRIGTWAWALTGEERLVAALVKRAEGEKTKISAKIQRRFDLMVEKQRKLAARVA